MDKNDSIFINSNPVSIDQITSVLTKSAQRNKDTMVIIQADQEVSHGKVVRMMDIAKRAGLTQLAIATSTMRKTVSEKR